MWDLSYNVECVRPASPRFDLRATVLACEVVAIAAPPAAYSLLWLRRVGPGNAHDPHRESHTFQTKECVGHPGRVFSVMASLRQQRCLRRWAAIGHRSDAKSSP